jgi:hypothetical protein
MTMADFLLLYRGGDPKWMEHAKPEEIQATMQAWGDWFKQLEASGNLRNPGAALAAGGAVVTAHGKRLQTDSAMSEVKELIGGYSVIAAATIDEATKLAKGSPFLKNNPQGTVLVRPVLEHG